MRRNVEKNRRIAFWGIDMIRLSPGKQLVGGQRVRVGRMILSLKTLQERLSTH